ncbi:very large a-kinase anchor protein [Limosa lapponica baueri]|uniref:Very large a-kinase anchor protein n=1 Tax=Limosa lapponica baueri TaxID=1758121 RepID=A0A2I0UBY2_LIMLA|nr:very large a-kinase anchor protein [Limosa lapponica baueri]
MGSLEIAGRINLWRVCQNEEKNHSTEELSKSEIQEELKKANSLPSLTPGIKTADKDKQPREGFFHFLGSLFNIATKSSVVESKTSTFQDVPNRCEKDLQNTNTLPEDMQPKRPRIEEPICSTARIKEDSVNKDDAILNNIGKDISQDLQGGWKRSADAQKQMQRKPEAPAVTYATYRGSARIRQLMKNQSEMAEKGEEHTEARNGSMVKENGQIQTTVSLKSAHLIKENGEDEGKDHEDDVIVNSSAVKMGTKKSGNAQHCMGTSKHEITAKTTTSSTESSHEADLKHKPALAATKVKRTCSLDSLLSSSSRNNDTITSSISQINSSLNVSSASDLVGKEVGLLGEAEAQFQADKNATSNFDKANHCHKAPNKESTQEMQDECLHSPKSKNKTVTEEIQVSKEGHCCNHQMDGHSELTLDVRTLHSSTTTFQQQADQHTSSANKGSDPRKSNTQKTVAALEGEQNSQNFLATALLPFDEQIPTSLSMDSRGEECVAGGSLTASVSSIKNDEDLVMGRETCNEELSDLGKQVHLQNDHQLILVENSKDTTTLQTGLPCLETEGVKAMKVLSEVAAENHDNVSSCIHVCESTKSNFNELTAPLSVTDESSFETGGCCSASLHPSCKTKNQTTEKREVSLKDVRETVPRPGLECGESKSFEPVEMSLLESSVPVHNCGPVSLETLQDIPAKALVILTEDNTAKPAPCPLTSIDRTDDHTPAASEIDKTGMTEVALVPSECKDYVSELPSHIFKSEENILEASYSALRYGERPLTNHSAFICEKDVDVDIISESPLISEDRQINFSSKKENSNKPRISPTVLDSSSVNQRKMPSPGANSENGQTARWSAPSEQDSFIFPAAEFRRIDPDDRMTEAPLCSEDLAGSLEPELTAAILDCSAAGVDGGSVCMPRPSSTTLASREASNLSISALETLGVAQGNSYSSSHRTGNGAEEVSSAQQADGNILTEAMPSPICPLKSLEIASESACTESVCRNAVGQLKNSCNNTNLPECTLLPAVNVNLSSFMPDEECISMQSVPKDNSSPWGSLEGNAEDSPCEHCRREAAEEVPALVKATLEDPKAVESKEELAEGAGEVVEVNTGLNAQFTVPELSVIGEGSEEKNCFNTVFVQNNENLKQVQMKDHDMKRNYQLEENGLGCSDDMKDPTELLAISPLIEQWENNSFTIIYEGALQTENKAVSTDDTQTGLLSSSVLPLDNIDHLACERAKSKHELACLYGKDNKLNEATDSRSSESFLSVEAKRCRVYPFSLSPIYEDDSSQEDLLSTDVSPEGHPSGTSKDNTEDNSVLSLLQSVSERLQFTTRFSKEDEEEGVEDEEEEESSYEENMLDVEREQECLSSEWRGNSKTTLLSNDQTRSLFPEQSPLLSKEQLDSKEQPELFPDAASPSQTPCKPVSQKADAALKPPPTSVYYQYLKSASNCSSEKGTRFGSILQDMLQPKIHWSQDNTMPKLEELSAIIIYDIYGNKSKQEVHSDVLDTTSWIFPIGALLRIIRGCWIFYEKPKFQGRKYVLEEGETVLDHLWDLPGVKHRRRNLTVGSIKHVTKDCGVPEVEFCLAAGGTEGLPICIQSAVANLEELDVEKNPYISVKSGIWLAYSDFNYKGEMKVLEECDSPFEIPSADVKSLRPLKMGGLKVQMPMNVKIIIYEKTHFGGWSKEFSENIGSVPALFGNEEEFQEIGSIRVIGGVWVAYEKERYKGRQYLLEEGDYEDRHSWGGADSVLLSFRFLQADFIESSVALFQSDDEDGKALDIINEEIPDLEQAGFGPETRSILVRSGVWVAYQQKYFCGEQYVLEKGKYKCFFDWGGSNNIIMSIRPIKLLKAFSNTHFQGACIDFTAEVSDFTSFIPCSFKVLRGCWLLYYQGEITDNHCVLEEGLYVDLSSCGCPTATIKSLKPIQYPAVYLRVKNRAQGKYLTVAGSLADIRATSVCASPYNGKNTQIWHYCRGLFKSKANNACLDVIGGRDVPGAKVALWTEHGKDRQKWRLNEDGTISSYLSDQLVLDIKGYVFL